MFLKINTNNCDTIQNVRKRLKKKKIPMQNYDQSYQINQRKGTVDNDFCYNYELDALNYN